LVVNIVDWADWVVFNDLGCSLWHTTLSGFLLSLHMCVCYIHYSHTVRDLSMFQFVVSGVEINTWPVATG